MIQAIPPTNFLPAGTTDRDRLHPRIRYQVGMGAEPLVWLRRLLPDRAFDALIGRGSGVPT